MMMLKYIYLYDGMLFNSKIKELLSFVRNWMKLEDIMVSEINEI